MEEAIARGQDGYIRGREGYKRAAELMLEAMRDNPGLTQKKVAELLGHKPPWVCGLLSWYRDGCPVQGGVFGREIAARRAKGKTPISTSKSGDVHIEPAQPCLPGIECSPIDAPPVDESEATRRSLAATVVSARQTETLKSLGDTDLSLVYGWDTDRQRTALENLTREVKKSIAAGHAILEAARRAASPLQAAA